MSPEMPIESAMVDATKKNSISTLALVSFSSGLIGFVTIVTGPFCLLFWLTGFFCGFIALVRIFKSHGAITGKKYAINGILLSGIPLAIVGWMYSSIISGMKIQPGTNRLHY